MLELGLFDQESLYESRCCALEPVQLILFHRVKVCQYLSIRNCGNYIKFYNAAVRQTKLAYINSVAKAPREVRRQQMKNQTAGVKMHVKPSHTAAASLRQKLTATPEIIALRPSSSHHSSSFGHKGVC